MISSLITRTIRSWLRWRRSRRIYRAMPKMREFDQQERKAQRSHGNVNKVRAARKAFVTAALREGGRT